MNILTVNLEPKLAEEIAIHALPLGNSVYPGKDEDSLQGILFTKLIHLIIADDEQRYNIDSVDFLKWVRSVDERSEYKLIILTKNPTEDFIRTITALNPHGVISKKNSYTDIVKKVIQMIDKINNEWN